MTDQCLAQWLVFWVRALIKCCNRVDQEVVVENSRLRQYFAVMKSEASR